MTYNTRHNTVPNKAHSTAHSIKPTSPTAPDHVHMLENPGRSGSAMSL